MRKIATSLFNPASTKKAYECVTAASCYSASSATEQFFSVCYKPLGTEPADICFCSTTCINKNNDLTAVLVSPTNIDTDTAATAGGALVITALKECKTQAQLAALVVAPIIQMLVVTGNTFTGPYPVQVNGNNLSIATVSFAFPTELNKKCPFGLYKKLTDAADATKVFSCITSAQCIALPVEGTGAAQKIYKISEVAKECIQTCAGGVLAVYTDPDVVITGCVDATNVITPATIQINFSTTSVTGLKFKNTALGLQSTVDISENLIYYINKAGATCFPNLLKRTGTGALTPPKCVTWTECKTEAATTFLFKNSDSTECTTTCATATDCVTFKTKDKGVYDNTFDLICKTKPAAATDFIVKATKAQVAHIQFYGNALVGAATLDFCIEKESATAFNYCPKDTNTKQTLFVDEADYTCKDGPTCMAASKYLNLNDDKICKALTACTTGNFDNLRVLKWLHDSVILQCTDYSTFKDCTGTTYNNKYLEYHINGETSIVYKEGAINQTITWATYNIAEAYNAGVFIADPKLILLEYTATPAAADLPKASGDYQDIGCSLKIRNLRPLCEKMTIATKFYSKVLNVAQNVFSETCSNPSLVGLLEYVPTVARVYKEYFDYPACHATGYKIVNTASGTFCHQTSALTTNIDLLIFDISTFRTDYCYRRNLDVNTGGTACQNRIDTIAANITANVTPYTVLLANEKLAAQAFDTNYRTLDEANKYLEPKAASSVYVDIATCDVASNYLINPDLLTPAFNHICVKNDANMNFKTDANTVFSLIETTVSTASNFILLKENCPFLVGNGFTRLYFDTTWKVTRLYCLMRLYPIHGDSTIDNTAISYPNVMGTLTINVLRRDLPAAADANNTTERTFIHKYDNATNKEILEVHVGAVTTECDGMVKVVIEASKYTLCIKLWLLSTQYATPFVTQTYYTFDVATKVIAGTALGTNLLEEGTNRLFTLTEAVTNELAILPGTPNKVFKYGCPSTGNMHNLYVTYQAVVYRFCIDNDLTIANAADLTAKLALIKVIINTHTTAFPDFINNQLMFQINHDGTNYVKSKIAYYDIDAAYKNTLPKEGYFMTGNLAANFGAINTSAGIDQLNKYLVVTKACTDLGANNILYINKNSYPLICKVDIAAGDLGNYLVMTNLEYSAGKPYYVHRTLCYMYGYLELKNTNGVFSEECVNISSAPGAINDLDLGISHNATLCVNDLTKITHIYDKVPHVDGANIAYNYYCRTKVTDIALPHLIFEEVDAAGVVQKLIKSTVQECLMSKGYSFFFYTLNAVKYAVCRHEKTCKTNNHFLTPHVDTGKNITRYCVTNCTSDFDKINLPLFTLTTMTGANITHKIPHKGLAIDSCVLNCNKDELFIAAFGGGETNFVPSQLVTSECRQIERKTAGTLVANLANMKNSTTNKFNPFGAADLIAGSYFLIDENDSNVTVVKAISNANCISMPNFKNLAAIAQVNPDGGAAGNINYCISDAACLLYSSGTYMISENDCVAIPTSNVCTKSVYDHTNKAKGKQKVVVAPTCETTGNCGDANLYKLATNAANSVYSCVSLTECLAGNNMAIDGNNCVSLDTCTVVYKDKVGFKCVAAVGNLPTGDANNFGDVTVSTKTVYYDSEACTKEFKWYVHRNGAKDLCLADYNAVKALPYVKYCNEEFSICADFLTGNKLLRTGQTFVWQDNNNYLSFKDGYASKFLSGNMFSWTDASSNKYILPASQCVARNTGQIYINLKTFVCGNQSSIADGASCTGDFFLANFAANAILSNPAVTTLCVNKDLCKNVGETYEYGLLNYYIGLDFSQNCVKYCTDIADTYLSAGTTTLVLNNAGQQECIKHDDCINRGYFIMMKLNGGSTAFEVDFCSLTCTAPLRMFVQTNAAVPSVESRLCFPNSTIDTDATYIALQEDATCSPASASKMVLKTNCIYSATCPGCQCVADKTRKNCPSVRFNITNNIKITDADCDEQTSVALVNKKMPSFEAYGICYPLTNCPNTHYIYIDYTPGAGSSGTVQLSCGAYCSRKQIFTAGSALNQLSTTKFCLNSCDSLEKLQLLEATWDVAFKIEFSNKELVEVCKTNACEVGNTLLTNLEEYEMCSPPVTDLNMCASIFGNIKYLVTGSATACIARTSCFCDSLACEKMYDPVSNVCRKRTDLIGGNYFFELTDKPEMVAIPEAVNPSIFVKSTHFECNKFGAAIGKGYLYKPLVINNDLTVASSDCIVFEKCVSDGNFVTEDGRCLSFSQCTLYSKHFLFGKSDAKYCVSEQECRNNLNVSNQSLVARAANYLIDGLWPTCFNCLSTQFYVPASYLKVETGNCATRCSSAADVAACTAYCTSTDYAPVQSCQSSCPSGLWQRDTQKVCQNFCPTFLDESQKICLNTCSSGYVKLVNITGSTELIYICLNSSTVETVLKMAVNVSYLKNVVTVDKCPEKYREISKKRCIVCEALIYDDLCLNECPQFTTDYNKTKTCVSCAKNLDGKINFYNGNCYSSSDPILLDKFNLNNEFNAYVNCGYLNVSGIDKQTGRCVSKCPIENEGFFNGYCERCTETAGTNQLECYIINGKFIKEANCPPGYSRNPQKQYLCITQDELSAILETSCPSGQQKNAVGQCVSITNNQNTDTNTNTQSIECNRIGQRLDTTLSPPVCVNCDLVFNEKCVDSCPRGYIQKDSRCHKCSDDTTQGVVEYFNGKCVKICGNGVSENCLNKTDIVNGAPCSNCEINCNGNPVSIVRKVPTCICLGSLKGPNCTMTLQTSETTAVQTATSTADIAQKVKRSREDNISIKNNIATIFDNLNENFSPKNLDALNSSFNSIIKIFDKIETTTTLKNFNDVSVRLQEDIIILDNLNDNIINYFQKKEILKKEIAKNPVSNTEPTNNTTDSTNTNNETEANSTNSESNTSTSGVRRLEQEEVLLNATIESIKQTIRNYVTAYVKKQSFATTLETTVYSTFTLYIYPISKDENEMKKAYRELEKRNIPAAHVDQCVEAKMRDSSQYPIISIIEWSQILQDNTRSKEYDLFVYDVVNREQQSCNEFTKEVIVSASNVNQIEEVKDRVLRIKSDYGVDLLDINSGFYEDRCKPFSIDGFAFTPKMKRDILFPKVKVECSEGCTYRGITDKFMMICECFDNNQVHIEAHTYELDSSNESLDFIGEPVGCNFFLDSENDWYRNHTLYYFAGVFLFIAILYTIKILQDEAGKPYGPLYLRFKESNYLPESSEYQAVSKLKVVDREDEGQKQPQESEIRKENESEANIEEKKEDISIVNTNTKSNACQVDHAPVSEVIANDERGFFGYYIHTCATQNLLLSPFFSYSLIKPYAVRVFDLLVFLLVTPFFVTLFTFDEHIEKIYENRGETAWGQIWANYKYGWDRILYAIICATFVRFILQKIVTPSNKVIMELGKGFEGYGRTLREEFAKFKRRTAIRLASYFFLSFGICVVSFYFPLVFIDYYTELNSNWLICIACALVIGWLVQFVLHFLHALTWLLAKKTRFGTYIFMISRVLCI